MKLGRMLQWLLFTGVVAAWPEIRRRQARTSSDTCTCPSIGPVTATVVQYTVITSSITVTSQGSTEFSTAPASIEVITATDTSTITVFTSTTTSALPGVTKTTTDTRTTTSTITEITTVTTCAPGVSRRTIQSYPDSMSTSIETGIRKAKRQDTESVSTNTLNGGDASVTTSLMDTRPILTFTSTISSRVLTCTCTPRPRTSGLAGTSTCSCPETTSTVMVSSTSTGVVFVTVVTESPTTLILTPTRRSTTTTSVYKTVSRLATTSTTDASLTLTSYRVSTVFETYTSTVTTCPSSHSTSTTTTKTSSSTRSAITATGTTFQCNSTAYFISTVNSIPSLYNIDLHSAKTFLFARDVGAGAFTNINGMGYNPLDNYLYAIATHSSGHYVVIRFTTTGFYQEILTFTASATPGTVGDIDTKGQYYFSGGGTTWFHVDLAPGSSTFGKMINSGTSTLQGYYVYDWAYLPGQGEFMYSLATSNDSTPNTALLRWSLTTHTWSLYQDYQNTAMSTLYFAIWGSSNATLWGLATETGRITRLALGGTPEALGVGQTGLTNGDGARCALAAA